MKVQRKEVGSVSRFSAGLGACGASYPNLWFTDKRANLTEDLLRGVSVGGLGCEKRI